MRYDDLIGKIQKANEDYYNYGTSQLTDEEYDRLVAQAERLGYVETVGTSPVNSIPKIQHQHPMLSLDKIHSEFEVKKFIKGGQCLAMYKADGLTISATYNDGVLVRLETRGDGEVGNDIMHHANSISNLPKVINRIGKYVIDGECVILKSDFDSINSEYKNSRNLAAGSLNLLDSAESAKRHLRFYGWDVIEGGSNNSLCANLVEANYLGFETVYMYVLRGDETMEQISKMLTFIKNNADYEGFPIDGVVIKYDDIQYGKSLGMTEHHPLGAVAFKYQDETYATKLKKVIWQVGKSGKITPVAVFNSPVFINGSEVERASLHNLSIMKNLGLTDGCTCYVIKANDIIPQIDHVDQDGDGDIPIPILCPICGELTKIVKDNNTEVIMCTNEDCEGKLLGKLTHFVSKKGMDIDGLSEATLQTFINMGWLHSLGDIYLLNAYQSGMLHLPGFGKKSVDKLLKSIEASTHDVDPRKFITALSIPNVGTGQAKLIFARFHNINEFVNAVDNGFDFSSIPGIGPILNRNIHTWMKKNRSEFNFIRGILTFQSDNVMNKPTVAGSLAGKSFVVTGSVNHYKNRAELTAAIEAHGGHVASSVSKNTDYLINNDVTSMTGKNKKAKELGVEIISEQDFLKMIN